MEPDWVDDFIARHRSAFAAGYDLQTEAISERILLIANLLKQRQRTLLAEYGLSWEEYELLSNLAVRDGSASPGELRRDLRLTTGAITNRLDRLEARSFLTRQTNPHDRRGLIVQLTAAGKQAHETAVAASARGEHIVTQTLNPSERKQLNRLLRKLSLAYGGTPAAARSRGDRPSAPR